MTGEREADTGLRSCGRCGGESPVRANFCMECGAPLEEAPAADDSADDSAGERRVVSVLFADLSGFTAYSERTDPEVVRKLAHEAAEGLGDIVDRYGGIVDKVIGDCVMAVFGAPVSHEDDPQRAVAAAVDMQRYINENKARFAGMPLRIGINTGEVMFAPVGSDGRFTVIGDAVNTAARLQSAAAKGDIVIGETTFAETAESAVIEELPPISAKGKEEPVPVWRVVGLRGADATPAPRRARVGSVGRAADAARMAELWQKVRTERQPLRACLIGGPGVGKSRIIRDLAEAVAESDALVARGVCLPYGEGITYGPIADVVRDLASIGRDAAIPQISERLDAFLEALPSGDLDELRTIASALANLMGAPTTPRGTYTTSRITRAELHWGIRRTLQLVASQRPMLVVIEDLQWAEPALLELVDFMAEPAGEDGAALLLLTAGRDELAERAPSFVEFAPNRRTLRIEALDHEASAALLASLLGFAELPEGPLWNLAARAKGNPLFLEETAAALLDSGLLGDDGRLAADLPESIGAPDSLRTLIGSRLDMLDTHQAHVAQTAAVVGEVFWDGALVAMGEDRERVWMATASLAERSLVEAQPMSSLADQSEWAFHHILIRDVAYERLSKERRVDLHQRCSEWVSSLPGGEDERIEIIAHHLEQATRYAGELGRRDATAAHKAVMTLIAAAEKAERREGVREAARFYERALDLLEGDLPETEVEVRLRRTRSLAVLGDLDAAMADLKAAAAEAMTVSRPDLRCRALLDLAGIAAARREVEEARVAIAEAVTLSEELSDDLLRARAGYVLANIRSNFDADLDGAESEVRRAMTLLRRKDQPELLAEGHLRLGAMSFNVGNLPQAEAEYEACVALAQQMGSLRYQAMATSLLGGVKVYTGPLTEAERRSREALGWLRRIGERYVELQTLRSLAILALRDGDHAGAERLLGDALDLGRHGGSWLVPEMHRLLADALIGQGRVEEAREEVAAARETARPEDSYAQAAVALAQGALAAAEGDASGVRAAYDRACAALADHALHTDLGDARLAYGRALEAVGDPAGALEQFALARSTYEAVGATGMLALVPQGEPSP